MRMPNWRPFSATGPQAKASLGWPDNQNAVKVWTNKL